MALWFMAVQYELHKLKVRTRVFYMKSSGTPGSPFTEISVWRNQLNNLSVLEV